MGHTMNMQRRPLRRRAQRGVSLLVILVMVLAFGLMTLTGFYLARNQYRLVGNIQHLEQAFNQTEEVIAVAENWLVSGTNHRSAAFTTFNAAQPQLHPTSHLTDDPKTMVWSDANSLIANDGRYLIELLAQSRQLPGNSMQVGQRNVRCRKVDLFRVTARSDSIRGASRLITTAYATDGC